MAKVHTHYDNLKVARDAPPEVIRAAYRALSQRYHPDRNPNDTEAARIMTIINASYAVLSDPERRRQHDEWIRQEEQSRGQSRPFDSRPSGASRHPEPSPLQKAAARKRAREEAANRQREMHEAAARRRWNASREMSVAAKVADYLAHAQKYWHFYGAGILVLGVLVVVSGRDAAKEAINIDDLPVQTDAVSATRSPSTPEHKTEWSPDEVSPAPHSRLASRQDSVASRPPVNTDQRFDL